MKKWMLMVSMISICIWSVGCRRVEPEVRVYPLAIGLDYTGNGYRIFYAMPDMGAYTGDGKTAKTQNLTWLYEGSTFADIEKQVRSSREQLLDLGHVQVLLFSERLLNQEQNYEEVLAYLLKDPVLGSGAYVFSCDEIDKVMQLNGEKMNSLGEYLVDLVDKEDGVEQRERPKTLQQLLNAWYNEEPVPKLLRVLFTEDYVRVLPSEKT